MNADEQMQRQVRAYLEYFRDMGLHSFYRRDVAHAEEGEAPVSASASVAVAAEKFPSTPTDSAAAVQIPVAAQAPVAIQVPAAVLIPAAIPAMVNVPSAASLPISKDLAPRVTKLLSLDQLAPLPARRIPPEERALALEAIRQEIGDCTRCPLAYGGRHTIVFGDGDPNASLMFVGEGPGADEDASGLPFVGKAGQLLNNMIGAMGLKREQVYIANVVKCRPPANRTPEPIEANTCSPFLMQQMDVVQPRVVVALGATAATYLLGVKQSLASLRGTWHSVRGAKAVVTYHPAFLLRDPRQKGEAWKDLQMVMAELGLRPPAR